MPIKKKAATKAAKKPAPKPPGKAKAAPAGKVKPKAQAKAKPPAKVPAKGGAARTAARLPAKSKATAAPTEPKNAPAPVAAQVPEASGERTTVRGLVTALINQQIFTDEEIIGAVALAMPGSVINKNIVGACRSEMNIGRRRPKDAPEGTMWEQIVCVDGVNVPKSKRPKKTAAARRALGRGKVAPENDPLAKIGIPQVKRTPARKAA